MKIKIVLADDHQLLIEGIRTVLNEIENIEIVAEVNTGTELLDFLMKVHPDLVILDLNIPGVDGIRCLNIIKERYTSVKVLVLTSYNQPELINEVKKLKAEGFLSKNSTSAEVKEAVIKILSGEIYFSNEAASNITEQSSFFIDDFMKKHQLTKREVDIIKLICKEKSSKQIAAELFLSEFTVNTHRKNIFRKLNVKNVAGLMNFTKENGLI